MPPDARHRLQTRFHDDTTIVFTDDFQDSPLWLDDVSPMKSSELPLPDRADVVVIGSGYTGLNAALELVRGGREVVILEAGDSGQGCSTRNGGQISTSIKPTLAQLTRLYGTERAREIRQEGMNSLDWVKTLVTRENIECDFVRSGRLHAAHTPRHYEALAREAASITPDDAIGDVIVVPRNEQRDELGSEAYHGGVVFTHYASLHPARYHHGLMSRVIEAGATLITHCAATSLQRNGDSFDVATQRGRIQAADVIVATNGYTGELTPWLQRRAIPINSYMIATEPLPEHQIDALFPTGRVVTDTRKIVYYYRSSPDRRRVVFGGRVSAGDTDPRVSAPRLRTEMVRIFPELADARVSHSWSGTVAYSFDELAHTGVHNGAHYAMCYCGSGVGMASYLGMRLGQRLLGLKSGLTAFDGLPHPTRPLYRGSPWFLPSLVAWHRWRDRQQTRRAA